MSQPVPDALDELRIALRGDRLVPVVGAGVSIAAAQLPTWSGLLRHGLDYAQAGGGCDARDLSAARASLDAGQLLDAAQALRALLRAPGGQYAAWLESVFGLSLDAVVSKEIPNRIADLLCPIVATTNYDDLLEQMLLDRHDPITWREPQAMLRALKKGRAVFHLHGLYRLAPSVVLGTDDYDELVRDQAYRAVLQTLWIDRTLLFIGCSFDGLQDPDFSRMLQWFSRTFSGASNRHYALMLRGSYTTAQQATWLHDLRVQVVPYGPTHAELSDALRALNENAERAYAKRMFLAKSLLAGQEPDGEARFVAVVEGAGVAVPDPKVREAAEKLFTAGRDARSRQRQNLSAMQLLVRSMVDPQALAAEMRAWRRYRTKFEGRFRETVRQAAGALFLFDDALLNALKRRGVDIHHNVLEGICRDMLQELERVDPVRLGRNPADAPWYGYQVENMKRILSTLHAILEASPESIFVEPEVGIASPEALDASLLILRGDGLELRKVAAPAEILARLPLELRARGGSFEQLHGRRLVIAFTNEDVIAWDPTISVPVERFGVDTAYGINSVDHRSRGDRLETIVATTAGLVYRLEDLRQVQAWRPRPEGFLVDIVMLPDARVFALVDAHEFPVLELKGSGCRERLTAAQLADQLQRLPLLGDHWRTRSAEAAAWYGDPPQPDSREEGQDRFESPRLTRIEIDGRSLLTLHVGLSFHVTDELVLLLDPAHDPLRVIGHFLVRRRLMAGFDMRTGDSGELSLLCALLSDFELGYDLAIWAKAARTREGIIFVQQGSTLRTKDDLIHVVYADGDVCFAADDSGGLFRFSIGDRSWQEIDRRRESRIAGLRFLK